MLLVQGCQVPAVLYFGPCHLLLVQLICLLKRLLKLIVSTIHKHSHFFDTLGQGLIDLLSNPGRKWFGLGLVFLDFVLRSETLHILLSTVNFFAQTVLHSVYLGLQTCALLFQILALFI